MENYSLFFCYSKYIHIYINFAFYVKYVYYIYIVVIWVAGMKRTLWGQGVARYSNEEIVSRLEDDCEVITNLLAGRRKGEFLFGSPKPNTIDAALYAHLTALFKEWDGNYIINTNTKTPTIEAYLSDVNSFVNL